MIEINLDKVAHIIILARDLGRFEPELDAFIERLDPDEQAELVAIFWIGRGAFEAEEFAEARRTAIAEASTPTAIYLKGSPHLSDHLEAGLAALGVDPDDLEEAVL